MSFLRSLSVNNGHGGVPPKRSNSVWSTRRAMAHLSDVYADHFSNWDRLTGETEEVVSPVVPTAEEGDDNDNSEDGRPSFTSTLTPPAAQLEAAPVDLRIRDLRVSLQPKSSFWGSTLARFYPSAVPAQPLPGKVLLSDVNLDVPAGSLAAVIGSSGSGKSTLLNTIAERFSAEGIKVDGSITFNWKSGISSTRSAYVRQEDHLIPNLTARETLLYASMLRFPNNLPAQNERLVDSIIMDLNLSSCAGTYTQRCSGGERRRVSIGIQLLGNASVLLLDEPTTGLDAASALSVVTTLQTLARRGRTVIMTIHQPRPEIFAKFDCLIVMCKGSPIYAGRANRCLAYVRRLGYPMPVHTNPAEFILGLASIDYSTPEHESQSRARTIWLKLAWKDRKIRRQPLPRKPIQPARAPLVSLSPAIWATALAPAVRRTLTLARRNLLLARRDKAALLGSILAAASLGLLAGLINFQLPRDMSGIRAREGALYIAISIISAIYLEVEVYRLVTDIRVFDQERDDGAVGAFEFVLSRRLSQLLVEDVPIPLLFSLLFYFLTHLRNGPTSFLVFFAFTFLSHYVVRCWAMVTIAISRDYASAALVSGLFITMQTFFAGFLIQISQLPPFLSWMRYLASSFYIYGGLASNEFSDVFFDCPLPGGEDNPLCASYVGDTILAGLGFPSDWSVVPIVIVTVFTGLYLLLSVLILHFKAPSIESAGSGVKEKKPEMDAKTANNDSTTVKTSHEADEEGNTRTDPVEVRVSDLSIYASKKPKKLKATDEMKLIADSLTIVFPAASFTAIMGPSGCGKTSLLKAVAAREQDNYQLLGKIELYNAAERKSNETTEFSCAYVSQYDNGLLPSLTVRETLRFAAELRLPGPMTTTEKHGRADQVLGELGLSDCANVRIGDASQKGISGGERRRVSIALQLLKNPHVLILDEPTSGLDAITATTIISLLSDLADRGMTVITTVHQSSRVDFARFDNIVLMARGGKLCFTGPRQAMLPHFGRIGLRCPRRTNPADFALDILNGDGITRVPDHVPSDPEARSAMLAEHWLNSRHLADRAIGRPAVLSVDVPGGGASRRNNAQAVVAVPARNTYCVLLRRALLHYRRTPEVLVTRLVQVPVFALLLTLFFTPLRYNQAGIQTQAGYVQFLISLFTIGLLQNSVVYVTERDLFYFERADGVSSPAAFFLQYLSLEIPFEIAQTLLFSMLAVYAIGLPRNGSMFGTVLLDSLLLINCGESLGIIFFTVFKKGGFALALASLALTIIELVSGVVNPSMPALIRVLANVSPSRHAVASIFPTALHGAVFACNSNTVDNDGVACLASLTTGEEVLSMFNLGGPRTVKAGFVGLVLCALLYRLLAYLLLWLQSVNSAAWIEVASWRGVAWRWPLFAPPATRIKEVHKTERRQRTSQDSITPLTP